MHIFMNDPCKLRSRLSVDQLQLLDVKKSRIDNRQNIQRGSEAADVICNHRTVSKAVSSRKKILRAKRFLTF